MFDSKFNNTGIFHFIVTGEQTNVLYDERAFNIIGINEEYDVIKDNSSDKPYFNIYFDPNSGEFGLQVFPVVIQDRKSMQGYSKQLDKRFKLICDLNDLGGIDG